MRKLTLAFYGLTLALYVPALLTNFYGTCPQYVPGGNLAQSCWLDTWDFYESTFVLIALLDFIPLSLTAEFIARPRVSLHHVGFMVTGAWMLIMAMPDVFLSWGPWALQLQSWQYWFNDYNAYWFGDVSFVLLLLNLYFFFHLTVFSTRIVPKERGQSQARTS